MIIFIVVFQVHRRETEIERLESLLESCRFVEDNKYMSAHNQLHEQSRKIDHLTKINKELETKLKCELNNLMTDVPLKLKLFKHLEPRVVLSVPKIFGYD